MIDLHQVITEVYHYLIKLHKKFQDFFRLVIKTSRKLISKSQSEQKNKLQIYHKKNIKINPLTLHLNKSLIGNR